MEKPEGIIKTMPVEWVTALPRGMDGWEKDFMEKLNNADYEYWVFNLPGRPKYEVLYFNILFNGAVRYRAIIIDYKKLGTIPCYTGEVKAGKIWVCVGAPVIKAKNPVEMKGFQGFRYTEKLF